MEIKNIPTKYQILFDEDNDWNKGNESKMTALTRGNMQALYLEYNKWELSQRIKNNEPEQPQQEYRGFADDSDDDKIQGFVF